MSHDFDAQRSRYMQALGKSLAEIECFPLREQTALLHELEETETRLSDIAKVSDEARTALAVDRARVTAQEARLEGPTFDFRDMTRSLRTLRDQLGERLVGGRGHLTER